MHLQVRLMTLVCVPKCKFLEGCYENEKLSGSDFIQELNILKCMKHVFFFKGLGLICGFKII